MSCTLQKNNVRMLTKSLGDSEHHLSSTTRSNVDDSVREAEQPDAQGSGWTDQQVEDLLMQADSLRGMASGGS